MFEILKASFIYIYIKYALSNDDFSALVEENWNLYFFEQTLSLGYKYWFSI